MLLPYSLLLLTPNNVIVHFTVLLLRMIQTMHMYVQCINILCSMQLRWLSHIRVCMHTLLWTFMTYCIALIITHLTSIICYRYLEEWTVQVYT